MVTFFVEEGWHRHSKNCGEDIKTLEACEIFLRLCNMVQSKLNQTIILSVAWPL